MARPTPRDAGRVTGDRPYPWLCPECLQLAVRPVTIAYKARLKHDGIEYIIDIPDLQIPKCGNCGELLFTNQVDDQIWQALRGELGLLAPSSIRAVRKDLGLSQSQLAKQLGVAVATVSRWETGALIQSRAMDKLLRLYFTFPEVRAALASGSLGSNPGTEDTKTAVPPTHEESACIEASTAGASLASRFPYALGNEAIRGDVSSERASPK